MNTPTIDYTPNKLPQIIDQVEQHLCDVGGMYQRNDTLVRIGERQLACQAPMLMPTEMCLDNVIDHLSRYFTWRKWDGRKNDWTLTCCPAPVAKGLIGRTREWLLPPLHAVISAPTLRRDGSILDEPGYDYATGIYYDPRDTVYALVPEAPTKEEARIALDVIIDLVREVPFVRHEDFGEVNRSVFLSAFLTAAIRATLPYAPFYLLDSPVPGTGKSMLCSTLGTLCSGGEPGVLSQGEDNIEMEKRLVAKMRDGHNIIVIDNCSRPIEGDLLCQLTTAPLVSMRILGRSETHDAPNSSMLIANGNNATAGGDMTRRTIRSLMDPRTENPESRVFETERPDKRITKDRGKYVIAALTVLRAFHVAGRPKQVRAAEGFDDWSNWIRSALVWLGEPDPWNVAELKAEDPEHQKTVNVLRQWHDKFGDKMVRVQDVLDKALERPGDARFGETYQPLPNQPLRDALAAVASDHDDGTIINKLRLAKWLSEKKHRIFGGFEVRSGPIRNGYPHWCVINNN